MSKFKHAQDRTVADIALIKGRVQNLHKLALSLTAKHIGILTPEDIEDLKVVDEKLERILARYEFIKGL